MAEESNSQTTEAPAQDIAPLEPQIDSLLETIPDLKELFTEKGSEPEQPTQSAPESELGALEAEALIPEGLKPEELKPEEPKKEDELPESVQKRIDKLVAQKKTAEEQATTLKTELEDLRAKYQAPPPLAPTEASPLADIETEQDLETRINTVQQAKIWALQNLDGGQVSGKDGQSQWIDGPGVKAILAKAEMILSKHAPERKVFLENRRAFDGEARREYPALFKAGTEANKTFLQWLTVFPECRKYPDISLIVGDALVGQKIRLDRAKAKSNGAKPPAGQLPLAGPAPAASPRVPQSRALSSEALAAIATDSSGKALGAYVDMLIDGARAARGEQR